MDFFTTLAHGLLHLSAWVLNNKELLGVVVGGSGAVSLLLEPVKKWLTLQSHSTITALHYLFALLAVGTHYIITSSSQNPRVLFVQALVVLGTNQFIYPLVTEPLSAIVSDAKAQSNIGAIQSDVQQVATDFSG